MIKVNILNSNNHIKSIVISGHSCYAEAGYDIVCAAVSSIVTTTINGILSLNETIKVTDDGDTLKIEVLKYDDTTEKLLNNMIKLLEGIEVQYKKNLKVLTKGE
jgi:hypothetical protein